MNKAFTVLMSFVCIVVIAFSASGQINNVDSSVSKLQYEGTDWTLNNLQGKPVTLSDFQGKPTILVFWATWCPYCKKLLPGIEKLHQKYNKQGLKILGVNIREDWKPDVYWRNFGYQFDTVIDGDEIAKIYAIRGTPGIVFIAPSGKVLGVKSFSDPNHPLLEKFAVEGLALMNK
jgi:cytochrome c biogenesis protein CcmG/thiol:disulfide interchange protein DsbE